MTPTSECKHEMLMLGSHEVSAVRDGCVLTAVLSSNLEPICAITMR